MALRYYYLTERDLTFVDGFNGFALKAEPWREKCLLITGVSGVIIGLPPRDLVRAGVKRNIPMEWIRTHAVYWERTVRDFQKPVKKDEVKFAGLKVFAKLSGKSEEKVKVALHAKKTGN